MRSLMLAPSALLFLLSSAGIESASAQILYVPGGGVNNLPAIVDPASKSVVGFLQSGGYALSMGVTPDSSKAYITDPFHLTVPVVDLASDTRVATIPTPDYPFYVALNNDGSRAYIGMRRGVLVINTSSNTVVAQIDVPASTYSFSISRTSPQLYVGTQAAGIFVIDTNTNSIVNSIPVASNLAVVGIAPSPDGSRLYFLGRDDANGIAGYLLTVDLSQGTVTGSIPLGVYPYDLAVTPDGSRIYASLQGPIAAFAGALIAVDVASSSVVGTVPLPGYVGKVALAPNGSEVWVAVNESTTNAVDVISMTTLAPTARITGFWAGAHDLVFVRPVLTYEAEASGNTLTGKARAVACAACSGGAAVAGVAEPGSGPTGGVLTFNNVAGVAAPQAELSIYYQHNERSPVTGALTVNGITMTVNFPPVSAGAAGPSKISLTIPGQNIGTVRITGVQGTSSSSLTIDRVTVQ